MLNADQVISIPKHTYDFAKDAKHKFKFKQLVIMLLPFRLLSMYKSFKR